MIKRTAALGFMMLANIILLAHAVIPHHHHKDDICIVNSLYQQEKEHHNHFDAKDDCKHDGDSDYQICVLKNQAVAVPQKSIKQVNNSPNNNDSYPRYQAIQTDLRSEIHLSVHPVVTQNYAPEIHFSSVNSSLSLRAPPVV